MKKVIVITGGTSGIGLQAARVLSTKALADLVGEIYAKQGRNA